jgi:hypothetical protein
MIIDDKIRNGKLLSSFYTFVTMRITFVTMRISHCDEQTTRHDDYPGATGALGMGLTD